MNYFKSQKLFYFQTLIIINSYNPHFYRNFLFLLIFFHHFWDFHIFNNNSKYKINKNYDYNNCEANNN